MKKTLRVICVFLLLLAVPMSAAVAEDDAEEKQSKPEKKREKIDTRSEDVLKEVLAESPKAKELYDTAVAYAVFDNTKAALGVSGGGGSGVAIHKTNGERTYMKMGTVGVGFGIGVKTYQVIMLFEKEKVFENFVRSGWQGDSQASAAAGSSDANAGVNFHNGMAIFVKTKKGLMANADVSGTKYWKSDLNDDE
jgi:lipid-binding SYLF domain-containing protein